MTYRADIDGLRAIAVLSVLLFHLGVPLVPGGFAGVDIFFVISGYLITGILLRDMQAGQFSLLHFYRKRALRILPALCFVLLATVAVGSRILLPSEMAELGRSIVATMLFGANIYYWSTLDYFHPDAKENPLLHTWSLGVEEQFYILLPLLMWLCFRYTRQCVVPMLAATVAISFALSVFAVGPMPRASFYLLPTRFWELGAGALLAAMPLRLAPRWAEGAGMAGFALLVAGIFGLNETLPFPGAAALLPVAGAALLIAAGGQGGIGRLLSKTAPVWIGQISYSVYLWHWPLIVFWKMRTDTDLTVPETAGLGAAAILFGALSTRFIERPFRNLPAGLTDGRILWPALVAVLAGIGLGWGLSHMPSALRTYPTEVARLDTYGGYFDAPDFKADWRYDRCHLDPHSGGFEAYDQVTCLKQDERPSVLLFGDSHAAHIWRALSQARPDLNILQASSTNCRPLPDNPSSFCGQLSDFIYHDWVPAHRPEAVILSGVWRDAELPALSGGIAELRQSGVQHVYVLGETVTYTATLPKILARAALVGADSARSQAAHLQSGLWQRDKALRDLVQRAGGTYVDLLDVACPMGDCRDRVQGVPLLFDSNHYTREGAAFVAGQIARQFQ
ncbi:acyltransferase family protein [Donghicola mangrovi]|uniref:Acyltransferase n=1 Tax=Donghicola mangrovi TaxID=2729614 RepID=A0A850QHC6_9RHOB|nr:acyltransferase family protein [Donghicola mangrovi]NVO25221.1 acyltransferase [Donghicola mangrovi]